MGRQYGSSQRPNMYTVTKQRQQDHKLATIGLRLGVARTQESGLRSVNIWYAPSETQVYIGTYLLVRWYLGRYLGTSPYNAKDSTFQQPGNNALHQPSCQCSSTGLPRYTYTMALHCMSYKLHRHRTNRMNDMDDRDGMNPMASVNEPSARNGLDSKDPLDLSSPF